MVSFIPTLVVPVLAFASLANAFQFHSSVSLRSAPVSHPILSAITVRSHLQSREEAFVPKEDCIHHYAEENPSLSGGRSRFVKTHTKYKLPALVLEDIEMVVGGIDCTESSITLQFPDRKTLDAIRPSWDYLGAFFIISSHPGCNADGERAPYLVSGIHYDLQKETAEFAVQPVTFQDAFKTMTVKFGAQFGRYPASSFRTHEGLRKRQAAGFSSVIRSASSTAASLSSTRAVSSASLTATRVSSSAANPSPSQKPNFMVHADIAKGLNATDRFDPNQVLFEKEFEQKSGGTESIKIACKDCSIGGTIDIVDGEFTVSDENNVIAEAVDFFKDGFIRAVVNNMTAHIALEASLNLASKREFEVTLIEVGIPGFQIPGIVTVGPSFRPVFTSSIELNGELSFSTGFEIKVPDNSTITLGIAKVTRSTVTGFQNTKVSTLPFQATSPSITLSLTAGLRADLSFGLSFFNGQGKADIGAFFDIPTLKLTVSTGTNFDEECKPVSTNVTSLTPFKFPSLVLVEFLVILDVGVQAEATIDFPGFFDPGTQVSTELAATTFSLANSCLSFDASKTRFVKPMAPMTVTAVRPGATGGSFAEVGKSGNKTTGGSSAEIGKGDNKNTGGLIIVVVKGGDRTAGENLAEVGKGGYKTTGTHVAEVGNGGNNPNGGNFAEVGKSGNKTTGGNIAETGKGSNQITGGNSAEVTNGGNKTTGGQIVEVGNAVNKTTGVNVAEVGKVDNTTTTGNTTEFLNRTATTMRASISSGAGKSRDIAGSLWWSGAGLLTVFFVALAL